MDSLKFHPGLPCPTLLRPAGGPPPKQPYGRFWGGLRPSSTPLDTPRRMGPLKTTVRICVEEVAMRFNAELI
jgi:hypothetical protein